ncbi:hypothetical protein LTR91_019510 [Friedmanniomyces endolithicus]|uniref:DUF6606 domain-containing protein n=1 Tax=Friedmanniomyces endolithicus TaxID=329885 RepID=A0AAN6K1B6_9PEZI|nr:hypothetical protein LTR94_022850 [Friedmanniomyces endolithicus]KAK0770129.1 hypothetical protein LTR38_017680 [Friedmanniomyces endolithicus]KAK0770905.1 hypothetical protein LTR75_017798 [Friedmanniomyces endolithicus]KAK0773079.1 hypothetical protein LTR59_015422 [Friedmanniomyces endolithicus]KAK0834066.1 hypothetical protein LTR03_014643 [Friedmanniomyces endolithicus]
MAAYRSLVDHVFLPPVLPQSDAGDAFDILIQTTFKALIEYKRLRADQHSSVENAIRMTGNMATAHVDSYIDEEKLARLMEAIPRDGGSIVLPVSAQNAGMIISRVSALDTGFAIRFEAFELAPINQAVYQSKGRLGRSFPGSAIDIDIPTFAEPGLVDTIARTLAKMNFQAAPGMQPQVRKAKSMVDEDRDTAHPGMIPEFIMGFLNAVGQSAHVDTICKNTREEVLLLDARSPWRRSPVWLLLRVALQLKLPCDIYKEFMAFIMSSIINDHDCQKLSSDMRFSMMAKVARRVYKLATPSLSPGNAHSRQPPFRSRWLHRLPALDKYVKSISARESAIFQPSVLRYLPGIDSHRDYTIPNLLAFETWVATHINQWSDLHKSDANACEQLYDLIERYHDLALRQYLGNPEALSVCYLTVLELWKALVVCATHLYPLLADYRLDLSMAFAQNLLLPSEAEMQCLMALETYFTTRENRAHLPSARCSYAITADCFSVRYFDQYPDLQVLLEKIEVQAAQEKAAKLEELARLKSEYERLMTLHRDTFCQYYEYVSEEANEWMPQAVTEQRHSYSCQKCEYKSKAAGLKIDIHEWPLPVSTTNQKAVVFEMRPPFSFIHWRDSLVFLRINVLQAEYTMGMRARAQHPLSTDEKLARFATGQHRRIGLLSEDKPHTGTHRKTMDISKATDAKICLASGLNYKYYDSDTGTFISGLACTKYHSTARTSSRGDRLRYRSSSIAHLPIRMAGPQIL